MTRGTASRLVAAIAAALLGLSAILLPTAAYAGVVTSIKFTTTGPVEIGFGDDWLLVLTVDTTYEDGPTQKLGPTDGTVDVYFSGIGGAFATGLAIQPDGNVYVSQPLAQPLLPAGSYNVTAIFNPSPGGYYNTSQTATPLVMKVTALDVKPAVEVINDAAVSKRPVISATLAGSYVDANGGAPAGTWHFAVSSAAGTSVFEADVAQAQGSSDPLRVEIDSKLDQGGQYSLKSTFTPVVELAGGVTVSDIPDSIFQTLSGSFGEALTAAVPIPIWLAILLLLLVLGLAAAAIVVGVKLSGRKPVPSVPGPAAPQRMPGDPMNVELVSLDQMGLPDPETIPELTPEGETKKLPTSTTWLLSDVEPATNLPSASEAPTERIDAVTAADLPTERISTEDIATERIATGETAVDEDSKE